MGCGCYLLFFLMTANIQVLLCARQKGVNSARESGPQTHMDLSYH